MKSISKRRVRARRDRQQDPIAEAYKQGYEKGLYEGKCKAEQNLAPISVRHSFTPYRVVSHSCAYDIRSRMYRVVIVFQIQLPTLPLKLRSRFVHRITAESAGALCGFDSPETMLGLVIEAIEKAQNDFMPLPVVRYIAGYVAYVSGLCLANHRVFKLDDQLAKSYRAYLEGTGLFERVVDSSLVEDSIKDFLETSLVSALP